jgi:hypothetical protein
MGFTGVRQRDVMVNKLYIYYKNENVDIDPNHHVYSAYGNESHMIWGCFTR